MSQSPMLEISVAPIFTVLRPATRIQSIAEQSSDVAFTITERGTKS